MATINQIDIEGITILKLQGDLTSAGLVEIEPTFESIAMQPGGHVVVDLTGVEMVTTPALSMFLAAANRAKLSGGTLIFTESRPPVRDVLHRLRLHSVLRTVPGLEAAIQEARA